MILPSHDALAIPRDDKAERALIDCLMHGATSDALDPGYHIMHPGRLALVLALDQLRWCGPWLSMATSEPRHAEPAAQANGIAAGDLVTSAGVWDIAGTDPFVEIAECYGMAGGHSEHIGYYIGRLDDAMSRRRMIDEALDLLRIAADTAAVMNRLQEVAA
ncbi:MAG: hypothetical protein ACK5Q5_04555 [Planctomycetaceae bacterium]